MCYSDKTYLLTPNWFYAIYHLIVMRGYICLVENGKGKLISFSFPHTAVFCSLPIKCSSTKRCGLGNVVNFHFSDKKGGFFLSFPQVAGLKVTKCQMYCMTSWSWDILPIVNRVWCHKEPYRGEWEEGWQCFLHELHVGSSLCTGVAFLNLQGVCGYCRAGPHLLTFWPKKALFSLSCIL